MRRLFLLLPLALVAAALGVAAAAAPDCTTQQCLYLPLAVKPPSNAPEPTNTATPTNPPPDITPTQTLPPSRTPTRIATPTASSTPTRTTTASPTATPTLPPPSFVSCGTQPDAASAPNWPVQITAINKATETVTLKNRSSVAIDLTNWNMCSITGGQHHPISGSLAPGEVKNFVNTGGSIWNNTSADPGALYNPNGQLVSYFNS